MSNTYLDYFGLHEDPFRLTPDPYYYFPSQEHSNALHSLDFTMNNREGFCLLTGEPGTGKTTLLRIFLEKWQDKAELALVMTPRLNPEEFLEAILTDLEVILPLSGNKNDMIMEFRDFLISHAENGRQVAIIVDEAQNLPIETLEELRLLSNLETEKQKLLQIILIGQTELSDKLAMPELKQLNQRISVRASLSPLPDRSTADYITARLLKAGSPGAACFEKTTHDLIHRLSGGLPRLINLIASRSLMAAFLEGQQVVHERQVKIAAEEVLRQERKKRKTALQINWWAAAVILLLIVAIVVGIAIWIQLKKLF